MTATWWRRNRLWLALLLPLLLLALSASAYRWANLYRPWHWSERVWPRAATGTLHQTYVGSDGQQYRRDVTVTVDGVTPVNVWEDGAAAPGARLWRVDLHLAAPPDQPSTAARSCSWTSPDIGTGRVAPAWWPQTPTRGSGRGRRRRVSLRRRPGRTGPLSP